MLAVLLKALAVIWELFRGLNSRIKGRALTARLAERYADPFSKSTDNSKPVAHCGCNFHLLCGEGQWGGGGCFRVFRPPSLITIKPFPCMLSLLRRNK